MGIEDNWMKGEKIQKELREVERLSFASKEMQDNLMESMQHQLQEVEKRRNDLMPEHQRVQKRSQKIQSIQDKKNIRKKAWRPEKKCGKSERKLSGRKSASHCCRTKSTKTQWQMRKWKQSFRDCRLEKKEEEAMLRRQEIAAWRPCGSRLLPCVLQWDRISSVPWPMLSSKSSRKVEEQMPGRDERRSEDEQEQGRASQQVALTTPDGVNQVAPASTLELDPRVRGVPGERGSAGRPCKRGPSRSPGRLSRDEEGDDDLGDLVP